MRLKLMLAIVLSIGLMSSSAMALPDLYADGVMQTPAQGPNDDLTLTPLTQLVEFDLLYEETPHADKNTLGYYTDLGVGSMTTSIFDDNDGVGTSKVIDFGMYSEVGLYLFNDLDDDGAFNGDDVMLFSQRSLTLPDPPGSDYQWFRGYDGLGGAVRNYEFDGLEFSGMWDALLFIDDDHVTNGNQDHNDMVVGITAVPEPTTMVLLGLGLAGAGIIRRRKK
jgi:hypothetical protein